MRIFSATLATETNTFSPIPTSLASYQDYLWFRPGEHPNDAPRFCTATLLAARRRAAAEGFTLVEGSCFGALPAGPTAREAYETMRDTILAELRAALPLDGVLLGLHGAMIAHGYDDAEADFLQHVRGIVGPGCPVGVELDPHCHLTRARLRLADITVLYKEFPHTDVMDRAEELLTLLLRTIRGEIRPVQSLYDCRQIGSYPTTEPAMRALVDRAMAREGQGSILNISLGHCFSDADVPEMSARVLVTADGNKEEADHVATEFGQAFIALRGNTEPEYLAPDAAIARALASPAPVVIADPADNPGGGAPGDNTTLLHCLRAHDVTNACLGPIWDPIAVRLCFQAGLGASFPLRFGGKTGPASADPVDALVTVTGLARDASQSFGPVRSNLGDCAAIRFDGIDVVLVTRRTQALGLELFRNLGVDPAQRRIIVVKSTNHFMAAYGPIAGTVLYTDAGGAIRHDYRTIPFRKVQRPIWPLDEVTEPRLIL
jgi:microcystin degradation protein MlrC